MEDFSKHLGINRTLSLICCMFCMFSPADGATVSKVLGSRAILHCNNMSISTLTQLTWKKDGVTLFSFKPHKPIHASYESLELNVNMSASESRLYPLIIERVQTSHGGNYTCETNTGKGTWEEKWELIITEHVEEGNWYTTVIVVAVPCACCLIFIITLTVLHGVRKRRASTRRKQKIFMKTAWKVDDKAIISITEPELTDMKCSPKTPPSKLR